MQSVRNCRPDGKGHLTALQCVSLFSSRHEEGMALSMYSSGSVRESSLLLQGWCLSASQQRAAVD